MNWNCLYLCWCTVHYISLVHERVTRFGPVRVLELVENGKNFDRKITGLQVFAVPSQMHAFKRKLNLCIRYRMYSPCIHTVKWCVVGIWFFGAKRRKLDETIKAVTMCSFAAEQRVLTRDFSFSSCGVCEAWIHLINEQLRHNAAQMWTNEWAEHGNWLESRF